MVIVLKLFFPIIIFFHKSLSKNSDFIPTKMVAAPDHVSKHLRAVF